MPFLPWALDDLASSSIALEVLVCDDGSCGGSTQWLEALTQLTRSEDMEDKEDKAGVAHCITLHMFCMWNGDPRFIIPHKLSLSKWGWGLEHCVSIVCVFSPITISHCLGELSCCFYCICEPSFSLHILYYMRLCPCGIFSRQLSHSLFSSLNLHFPLHFDGIWGHDRGDTFSILYPDWFDFFIVSNSWYFLLLPCCFCMPVVRIQAENGCRVVSFPLCTITILQWLGRRFLLEMQVSKHVAKPQDWAVKGTTDYCI